MRSRVTSRHVRAALTVAAGFGNKEMMSRSVPRWATSRSTTPMRSARQLIRSIINGHELCAKLLLGVTGIGVNLTDIWGQTALMHAAAGECLTCVKLLLDFPGIDITLRDEDGDMARLRDCQHPHGDRAGA